MNFDVVPERQKLPPKINFGLLNRLMNGQAPIPGFLCIFYKVDFHILSIFVIMWCIALTVFANINIVLIVFC